MELIMQKGEILQSPPVSVPELDYVVVYNDMGGICMVLHNIDSRTVISVTAEDERFNELLAALGIEKNKSSVKELTF